MGSDLKVENKELFVSQEVKVDRNWLKRFFKSVAIPFIKLGFFYNKFIENRFKNIDSRTAKTVGKIARPLQSEADRTKLVDVFEKLRFVLGCCSSVISCLNFIFTLASFVCPVLAVVNLALSFLVISLNVVTAVTLYIKCGHDKHLLTALIAAVISSISYAVPIPMLSNAIGLAGSGLGFLAFNSYFTKYSEGSQAMLNQEADKTQHTGDKNISAQSFEIKDKLEDVSPENSDNVVSEGDYIN